MSKFFPARFARSHIFCCLASFHIIFTQISCKKGHVPSFLGLQIELQFHGFAQFFRYLPIFFWLVSLIISFFMFLFDFNHVYNNKKPKIIRLARLAIVFAIQWLVPSLVDILATILSSPLHGFKCVTSKLGIALKFLKRYYTGEKLHLWRNFTFDVNRL